MNVDEQLRDCRKDANVLVINESSDARSFENKYLAIRTAEGRIYSDAELKVLPYLGFPHPNWREWGTRRKSLRILVDALKRQRARSVLELGCGNGWLSARLAEELGTANVLGVDVNLTELKQAARVFRRSNLRFACADIFSCGQLGPFDAIVAAASIQYFPDLRALLRALLELKTVDGLIYLLDSHLYRDETEAEAAKQRSIDYYRKLGFDAFSSNYNAHTWDALDGFSYRVLYDPSRIRNRIRTRLTPFPLHFPIVAIRR
jgi:SAM-dependent methyltransferase